MELAQRPDATKHVANFFEEKNKKCLTIDLCVVQILDSQMVNLSSLFFLFTCPIDTYGNTSVIMNLIIKYVYMIAFPSHQYILQFHKLALNIHLFSMKNNCKNQLLYMTNKQLYRQLHCTVPHKSSGPHTNFILVQMIHSRFIIS